MVCNCEELQVHCTHHPQEAKKTRTFPNDEKFPPYLPQPQDEFAPVETQKKVEHGPWATGRLLLSPSGDLMGVRPIVDRYTITRYSPKDWRKRNQEVLDKVFNTSEELSRVKHNTTCTIKSVSGEADKHQCDNAARLQERLKEVRDCSSEIEALIKEFRDEIVLLTETKIKLKYSLPALKMPESIAGECIDRRTSRYEPDLVYDEVEIELVKELSMIRDTRDLFMQVIAEIEKQILSNRACKDELEHTWSDKKETCELESINVCLKNTTTTIGHYGGATRFPENQSSPESWAIYNVTLINVAKDELGKSRCLRDTAENKLLTNSIRDLINQSDKVYTALKKRVEETDKCRQMFEKELQDVLRQISEAESLYDGLVKLKRQLEINSKVVETRLDNRLQRPRVENCRDQAQYGLMDEVKFINEGQSSIQKQIDDIDKVVSSLYEARSNLEFVILTKRKSLYVDQQRCLAYRDRYPDAATLSGGIA